MTTRFRETVRTGMMRLLARFGRQPQGSDIPRALAIVRDGPIREALRRVFAETGWILSIADCAPAALDSHPGGPFGVVFYQRDLCAEHWEREVSRLSKSANRPCVVLLSETTDNNLWDELGRHGGTDIVRTPISPECVVRAVQSGWRLWRSQQTLRLASQRHC